MGEVFHGKRLVEFFHNCNEQGSSTNAAMRLKEILKKDAERAQGPVDPAGLPRHSADGTGFRPVAAEDDRAVQLTRDKPSDVRAAALLSFAAAQVKGDQKAVDADEVVRPPGVPLQAVTLSRGAPNGAAAQCVKLPQKFTAKASIDSFGKLTVLSEAEEGQNVGTTAKSSRLVAKGATISAWQAFESKKRPSESAKRHTHVKGVAQVPAKSDGLIVDLCAPLLPYPSINATPPRPPQLSAVCARRPPKGGKVSFKIVLASDPKLPFRV